MLINQMTQEFERKEFPIIFVLNLMSIHNSSILLTNVPFRSKENENKLPNSLDGAALYDLTAKTLTKFKPQRSHLVDNITIYVTGDTAFLVIILGMEGMSSHHCIHCLLRKKWLEDWKSWRWNSNRTIEQNCNIPDSDKSGPERTGVKNKEKTLLGLHSDY